jgi:branched-chain amino acid transport system ATP-binding protein
MSPFAESWLGISISAFVVFGGFALMTGQALARTWRAGSQSIGYGVLLSLGARLNEFVLFIGRAQRLDEYIFDNLVFVLVNMVFLVAVTALAHRITLARMMVTQYPWMYERVGLFSWRAKA